LRRFLVHLVELFIVDQLQSVLFRQPIEH
jgi:hypothetical protein